jgi:hypothetical protein
MVKAVVVHFRWIYPRDDANAREFSAPLWSGVRLKIGGKIRGGVPTTLPTFRDNPIIAIRSFQV